MKKTMLLLSAAWAFGTVFCACGDDKPESSGEWFDTPTVEVEGTMARVSCTTTLGVGIVTAENAGFVCTAESGSSQTARDITVTGTTLTGRLQDLLPDTRYTVRAFATLGSVRIESPAATFRTEAIPEPESQDLTTRTGWAELPAMDPASEELFYAAHSCEGLPGGRNYTVCYDVEGRIGVWSAFPLHECYRGDQTRTDKWAYDPELPRLIQPSLTGGSYQPQPGYSKGHLLASEDRTVNYAANVQTFYVTNVAPQWQNSFNSGVWSSLEADCWNNICRDTLYVVSGVWGVHDTATVTDKEGTPCRVPSHFFRVLLRSKEGTTGRKVQGMKADELQCVGFWFENRAYPSGKPSANMVSVAEIERRTGMRFFVNVPNAPKETFDAQAWNFR